MTAEKKIVAKYLTQAMAITNTEPAGLDCRRKTRALIVEAGKQHRRNSTPYRQHAEANQWLAAARKEDIHALLDAYEKP